MLYISILIIICFMQCISASNFYGCVNGTVYINNNKLVFYETTDFPKTMSSEEKKLCNLTFVLAEKRKKLKMFTSFVQIDLDKTLYSFMTLDNYSFQIRDSFAPLYDSQKGIVIFEEDDKNCPLESLSKTKPFKINNEKEILYIYSNYYKNRTRKNSCFWRMEAPEGYGFKIVVQTLAISSQTLLQIKNTTDLLLNERNVKINYPHYNSDNYLEINLTKGDPIFVANIEFQSYISIVKREQVKQEIDCPIIRDGTRTTWMNNVKGYSDNSQCSFSFVVPNHHVVIFMYGVLELEQNNDYISYNTGTGNDIVFGSDESEHVFEPYKNGTEKQVFFKFVSDGSVYFNGFDLTFELVYCKCENRLALCGTINMLMNHISEIGYYCGNLQCNITIGPCPSALTSVEIQINSDPNDVYRILSNNQTILDIYLQKQTSFTIYLDSNNLNIFEVITFSSPRLNTLVFSINSVSDPTIGNKIVLSNINTSAVLNTNKNVITTIEMNNSFIEQNISFILYSLDPRFITLYNNESLTTTFNNCFTEITPNICVIKESSFALYQVDITISAVTISNGSKNCVFQKDIFLATRNDHKFSISAISSQNGACILTILLDNSYYISNIWTTSVNENVKIFAGADKTKLFLEYNSKTAQKWKNVILLSPIYTILLPKAEALHIMLKYYDQESIAVAQYPFLSLITTPWYGCSNAINVVDHFYITYLIKSYSAKFTVLDYTFSKGNLFYFQTDTDKIVINKTGQSMIFSNQNVSIIYYDLNHVETSALIFIETYEFDNDITT